MTVELTGYLCCTKVEGVEIEPPREYGSVTGLSQQEVEIVADIVPSDLPLGCDTGLEGKVTIYLHTMFGYVYICRNENQGYLDISYQDPGASQDYTEITYKNHTHCQWIETQLAVDGTPRTNVPYGYTWVYTMVNSGPGEIPEDRDDVFPNAGAEHLESLTDNFIVPGMRVRVNHIFWNSYETRRILAVHDYYQTPRLTGGQIAAVNGEYNDPYITYDVALAPESSTKDAARVIVECHPSDWVEWEVDDFVFVTKPISGHSHYTIIPLKIGREGS